MVSQGNLGSTGPKLDGLSRSFAADICTSSVPRLGTCRGSLAFSVIPEILSSLSITPRPSDAGSLMRLSPCPLAIYHRVCFMRQVETYMRSMASALLGVLATVGGVPIIRALPGGPTQMISELLSKVSLVAM